MTIDLKHHKIQLETELAALEAELKTVGRRNPSNPADWEATSTDLNNDHADPNDVADSIEGYEGNSAILKQLEIEYNQVKKALERIDAKTYGTCSVCGNPIDPKRLEAFPAADTCILHAR
jgi:DnaK suppressor protein